MASPRTTPRHDTRDLCALTAAEESTLRAFADARDFDETAARLGVKPSTLKNRTEVIRQKLGARTMREAVELWRGMVAA